MKCAKAAFLFVALGWCVSALAGKVICIKIVNPETGDYIRECGWIPEDDDLREWAFKVAFYSRQSEAETAIGHYNVYSPFEEMAGITTCEGFRNFINTNSNKAGQVLRFGCLTEAETIAFRDAAIERFAQKEVETCNAYHKRTMSHSALKASVVAMAGTFCALPGIVGGAISLKFRNSPGMTGSALWVLTAGSGCVAFTDEEFDNAMVEMCGKR